MPPAALILSHDAVAAALIGSAAELAGLEPTFPGPGEAARDALRRIRPACVLADCARQDASTETFIGPAMMMGARVAVFCASHDTGAVARSRRLAQRYDVAFIHFPEDAEALHGFLAGALEQPHGLTTRSGNVR